MRLRIARRRFRCSHGGYIGDHQARHSESLRSAGGAMVDRYATEVFHRYCVVRRLSPAQARAELELFEDLVLMRGLIKEHASWTN